LRRTDLRRSREPSESTKSISIRNMSLTISKRCPMLRITNHTGGIIISTLRRTELIKTGADSWIFIVKSYLKRFNNSRMKTQLRKKETSED
jgi:hypothetical protein